MTKEEFIKKWVVAYESKEQQIEFANEMKADLEGLVELHSSILHINAKNLKPQTVKMINKMVEKVNENESIYPINGYAPGNYFNACHSCKELFLGDKLAVTCKVCALEAAYIYLTVENTRLREALDRYKKVSKMIISTPSKSNADKDELRQWQHTSIHMLESIK